MVTSRTNTQDRHSRPARQLTGLALESLLELDPTGRLAQNASSGGWASSLVPSGGDEDED